MPGCGVHLKNQLVEKAEEQGWNSLTDDERRVAKADEDELDDIVPDNYGPASDEWDGDYCEFCYTVGRVGAFVFGVLIPALVIWGLLQLDVGQLTMYGGGGLATLLGIVVWRKLDGKVKVRGYFPVLGPKLGPIVEKVAASAGIYLTATARQEYGQPESPSSDQAQIDQRSLPDDAVIDDNGGESVDVHLPPNPSEREEQLAERLEQQQQLTKEERARKNEERAERQEKEQELGQVQEKLQGIKQKKQEKEKEAQQYEDLVDTLFGLYGRDKDLKNAIPLLGWDEDQNPVFKGFVVNQVWHDVSDVDAVDHYWDEYPNALTVDTLQDAKDLSQAENGIPDRIDGMEEFNRLTKYGRWLLDPTEVSDFPKYMSPSHPEYPNTDPSMPIQARDEYPNVLFWNSPAGLRKARKEPDAHSDRPKLPFFITAYDDNGNHVPPAFDPRGSESSSELRDENRKLERLLGDAHNTVNRLQKEYEKLQHEYTRLQNELDHQQAITTDARENEIGALTQAQKLTRELETSNTSLARMDNELDETETLLEEADTKRKQHRRDKIEESDSLHEEVETAKSQRDRVEKITDAFEIIRSVGYGGNGKDVDLDAVANGESEYSKEDVVRIFLEDDDLDGELGKVQKSVTKLLTKGVKSGGASP